jgi:hypothetical protein
MIYATSVANSNTAVNDIINPTDLHIEQKYLSEPEQSSCCGKCMHCPVVEEQLRCSPIVLVKCPPSLESTVHVTQSGMKIAAKVIAVAGSGQ